MRSRAVIGTAVAALALAGCGSALQQPGAGTASQAATSPSPAATPGYTSTTPSEAPQDLNALKHQAFHACSGSTPDDLKSKFNAPTSDPVDIADAYARTFPTADRVPVAEGCFSAVTGQSVGGTSTTP